MLGPKPPSSRTTNDSEPHQHASSAGEGNPWLLFYNATRRLSVNRPLTGDLVALALLLQARGALSVTQIASALVMNVGSASDFCARAVASGLFVSTRMPGDKRQRIVDLSPTAVQRLTR